MESEANRYASGNCEEHGSYTSPSMWRHLGCPSCMDPALASFIAQEDARWSEQREREAQQAKAERLRRCGLRGRFADATFANFAPHRAAAKDALAEARTFAEMVASREGNGGGLFLIGPVGVGKTHLGAAMVRHLIDRGPPTHDDPLIASVRQIVRALRATWARDAKRTEGEVIGELAAARLLVIDEIGVGFGADAELVQLFDVVDARYQLRHPTVVLSNLTMPMIRSTLGDRLYDRLQEGSRTVVMQWESYRSAP